MTTGLVALQKFAHMVMNMKYHYMFKNMLLKSSDLSKFNAGKAQTNNSPFIIISTFIPHYINQIIDTAPLKYPRIQ
jgi:hypothetical protein